MRSSLLALLAAVAWSSTASAKIIHYHWMDSLALMSTDIVLCDEVEHFEGKYGGGQIEFPKTTISVVRVIKGDLKPGERLTVVTALYERVRLDARKVPQPQTKIPLGRAVYFLTKQNDEWNPVMGGVKPIIDGEAYCYGQFAGNPGNLYPARMAPENIQVPASDPYGEELLLADIEIALEKAKHLTEPVFLRPGDDSIIRKGYPPPPPKPSTPPLLLVSVVAGGVVLVAVVCVWLLTAKGRRPTDG